MECSSQVSSNLTAQSKYKKSPNWRTVESIRVYNYRMLEHRRKYLSPDSAQRSTSCSRYEACSRDSLERSNVRARSHSDSDALPSRFRFVTIRSPKISKTMSRRSIGFVSSPVKPVREIRKIYSPKQKAKKRFSSKKSGEISVPGIVIEVHDKNAC